ncbi:hypothetical protein GCM10010977_29070 [Citricoccus zhacaiensis]|uniref:DUF8175 domain-containing protein n=1 Tax=Citricoccus zhacaiensis TaxID=489142 RepID=A0ABQ2M9X7_9MICC|nr:hypothetical protein [Citricoccus zhacaiensis]GGO48751.1 hypothetical protein GCM10010977_29070 [Citricoccus zhacaiensis]
MAKNKNTDSPGTQSLGWWVSGGLLVVLIVAIVVGVVLWPRDTTTAPENTLTPTATATAPEQAPTSAPAQAGAACQTSDADQTVPSEAPETVWKTHPYQMLMPTSEKYGPSTQDGNLWTCFERSPTGAIFAGPNLLTAISMGEAEAAIPGPGRDEMLQLVEESGDADFERPVYEGFRVLAADMNSATIDYWITGQGTDISQSVDLVWDNEAGDWKLNLETPGEHPRVSALEDTSPYVRWR